MYVYTTNNAIIIIAQRIGAYVTAFVLGYKRNFDNPPVAKGKQTLGDIKGIQGLVAGWGKEKG